MTAPAFMRLARKRNDTLELDLGIMNKKKKKYGNIENMEKEKMRNVEDAEILKILMV